MSVCFFIFQYVHFESGYDQFNTNRANLYRVPITFTGSLANNGTEATNHPAVGPSMKANFPEVVEFARLWPLPAFMHSFTISYIPAIGPSLVFNEDRIYLADPSFLKMFSYPLLKGDPENALSGDKTIIISKTISRKYFGEEDPMGKTLHLNGKTLLKVTGIFKDVPENSHVNFDMLISSTMLGEKFGYDNWTWPEFYTYVLLAPGTDPRKIEEKFPPFIQEHLGVVMKQLGFGTKFSLQAVTDI